MPPSEQFIPIASLTARLARARSRIAQLSAQLEDLRREEKLLDSLLAESVTLGSQAEDVALKHEKSNERVAPRAEGVVDAIMAAVSKEPGITRNRLVEVLRDQVNPFDSLAARRTIVNNLGNQIRGGRIRTVGEGLFPVGAS